MSWKEGKATSVTVHSNENKKVSIIVNGIEMTLQTNTQINISSRN
jgi:hypothetical protein